MDHTPETNTDPGPQASPTGTVPGPARPLYRQVLAYAVFALIVATVSAFFSYRLLSFGEETKVPRLVGRSQRDAEALALDRNIQVRVTSSVYHPEIPVGFVAEQNIASGTEVKEGQVVAVILSKGPSQALIPDFSGKKLEEARFLAVEQGLEVSRVSYTRHDTIPNGYIASQNPPPGQRGSSFIKLLVSQGPYLIFVDVPDLFGLSQDKARVALESRGLSLLYTGSGKTVTRQEPGPGTRLQRGDAVEVHLAGP